MSEAQRQVDGLAAALRSPVMLYDIGLGLIAYSAQQDVDEPRARAILERRAPVDIGDVLVQTNQGKDPAAIDGSHDGASRLCVPVRASGELLGFVFVSADRDALFTTQLREVVADAAFAIASTLHREQLQHALERSRCQELLRDLLDDEPALHDGAAAELIDLGLFVAGTRTAAVVVSAITDTSDSERGLEDLFQATLDEVAMSCRPRHALTHSFRDHGVLVLAVPEGGNATNDVTTIGEQAYTAVRDRVPRERGWQVTAAIGDVAGSLAEVRTSYRQGLRAASLARHIDVHDRLVRWSDLGIYAMLAPFATCDPFPGSIPEPIKALLAHGPELVTTVEEYLDRGCAVGATAVALSIHRGTLYYRIKRVEDMTGYDLRDGEHRLIVHLGLKLARLTRLE